MIFKEREGLMGRDYGFYELELGVKTDETDADRVYRGLKDAEYSMVIKADHTPDFDEAEAFIREDLKRMSYDGAYSITEVTEDEVRGFFDTSNIDNWKVLRR